MANSRHDEFLDALPADWEKVTLDEIGEIIGGGTPSRTNPAFWGGDIPWVTPSEISELGTKVLLEARECITESGLKGSAARLLPVGTLLITTRATVGAVAIAGVPMATNQGFRSIVCNETADPNFYYHLLRRIAAELRRLASGSTFDEISRRDLGRIVVPRPPREEQQRIAMRLDETDGLIEETVRTLGKLRALKAGLAEDLLAGHVRVTASAPASEEAAVV